MTDRARYASLLRETAGQPLGASLRSLALSLRAEERLAEPPPMQADRLRMLARALRNDPAPEAIEDAAATLEAVAIEREDGK